MQGYQNDSQGLPAVNYSMNLSSQGPQSLQTNLIMQGNSGPIHTRNRNDPVSTSLMFPPALKGKKQL